MHQLTQFTILAPFVLTLGCSETPKFLGDGEPIVFAADDWPWWRGPDRNGVAAADQQPPTHWSETENVVWKAEVPGRGHGSATVVGDHVYLAAAEADRQMQSVLCFDRKTGKQLWQTVVHKGGFDAKGNAKTSQASSTPACDGRRIYVNFLNGGAIWTTALDLDGKQLWQTRVSDFVTHQGFGSSPAIYKGLVLVSADHKGGGAIAGLDRATGKVVWTAARPKLPNYASPIVLTLGGRDQLIMIGCNLVTSYDPLTGKVIWETKGSTEECVTSVVTDGKHVFSSGGYPTNHVSAVLADGSGKVAWENTTRIYVPSLVVHNGFLFGVQDGGTATCWKCDTGKQLWTGRLGGTFSSSPVLVGDRIYTTNEAGKAFVFKANPTKFELEAENQLGDEVFATPTICGGRVYMRIAIAKDGKRQEWLYCLGAK